MQQTTHNLGHSKHHNSGKNNRNPRNNQQVARETNRETEAKAKEREWRKGPTYTSVAALFGAEKR